MRFVLAVAALLCCAACNVATSTHLVGRRGPERPASYPIRVVVDELQPVELQRFRTSSSDTEPSGSPVVRQDIQSSTPWAGVVNRGRALAREYGGDSVQFTVLERRSFTDWTTVRVVVYRDRKQEG